MITAFYAGILGIVFVALTMAVVRLRHRHKISLGDGGHEDLQRRIRAQGNFAETVPLALILLGFAEMQNLPFTVIHILGILLVIGRLAHAAALYTGSFPLRAFGMIATLAVIAITSIWDIYFILGALI